MDADNPTQLCEQCGGARPARYKRFCSRRCKDAAHTTRRVGPCERCGATRHIHARRFCSTHCAQLAMKKTPAERFWAKVDKGADCWLWTGSRNPAGYGNFGFNGRSQLSNRIAWELTNGPIPEGLLVLHRCDNPPCVRPDHLFLGTHQDNVSDMLQKGRGNAPSGDASGARKHPECLRRGETSGMSKLTDDAVRLIRAEYAIGATILGLAQRFNVARTTIREVVMRRAWKHIA